MMVVVIVGAIAFTVLTKISGRSGGSGSSVLSRQVLSSCVLAVTLVDLWLVSGLVRYSEIIDDPPIGHLAESPVREILSRYNGSARIFAPGANLPSVLGAASTPAYLTFGPAEYVDPQLTMPDKASPEQVAWLQRAGVTHVLSFEPLGKPLWPVRLIWQGHDRLLNPAWARREPLYLYELQGTRGRTAWADTISGGAVRIAELKSNRVVIEAGSNSGGTVVLTDLMSPGWQVTIDGQPAEGDLFEKMYRAVEVPPGKHQIIWTYKPRGIYWGTTIGLLTFVLLVAAGHLRYWHPQRCRFLDEDFDKRDKR
jgi:hypothetical protein